MKKNKMMRLASVLLVLVMLTTCVISGTFAKYVTEDDAHDEARVAKWGIVITATDDADSKVVVDTKDDANEADISIAKDLKLLAPGTKGNIANVNIKGQPEVAFDVSISVNLDLGDKWEVDGNVYCPLVFKVNDAEFKIDGASITTVAELETAVEEAVIKALLNVTTLGTPDLTLTPGNFVVAGATVYAVQYAADAEFYKEAGKSVSVDWSWAYSTSDANDELDTALGDLATAPTLNFDFAVQVTQID